MATHGGVDRDALEHQLRSLVEARLLDPLEILLVERPTWPDDADARDLHGTGVGEEAHGCSEEHDAHAGAVSRAHGRNAGEMCRTGDDTVDRTPTSRPGEELAPATSDLLDLLRRRAAELARGWAEQLLGPDDGEAKHVLARLIGALYPGDRPFDPPPDWWRTPLGKVTGRRLGHPSVQAVSSTVAGAMLGITRQGVHDLIRRGKLTRHPDGGVTVESVRERLAGSS